MADRTAQEARLNWRLLLYVVLGASIALLALMVYSPYGDLLYILFIAPLIGLAWCWPLSFRRDRASVYRTC